MFSVKCYSIFTTELEYYSCINVCFFIACSVVLIYHQHSILPQYQKECLWIVWWILNCSASEAHKRTLNPLRSLKHPHQFSVHLKMFPIKKILFYPGCLLLKSIRGLHPSQAQNLHQNQALMKIILLLQNQICVKIIVSFKMFFSFLFSN